MRRFALMLCFAVAVLAAGVLFAPQRAEAFGCEHAHRHDHYDCYAYYPSDRGWYPYYNSGQWRSAREMRWRRRVGRVYYQYPQFNPAWGHPVRGYRHRAWHNRHHGGHHIGHW